MATLRGAVARVSASIDALRGVHRMPFPPMATAFYDQQPSCQIPILWSLYEQYLGRRSEGTFVEVGAYDGVFVSNSWGLAQRGWTGLMIEPVASFADRCRQNHAKHPNVRVLNSAVGRNDSETLTLHVAETLTTSRTETLEEYETVEWAHLARKIETIKVPSRRLDLLLEEHGVKPEFDVLIVDVEGSESDVYAGFDIDKWKPAIQIVEISDVHPDLVTTRNEHARLSEVIRSAGYTVVFKDAINTVFVRRDVWAHAHANKL